MDEVTPALATLDTMDGLGAVELLPDALERIEKIAEDAVKIDI